MTKEIEGIVYDRFMELDFVNECDTISITEETTNVCVTIDKYIRLSELATLLRIAVCLGWELDAVGTSMTTYCLRSGADIIQFSYYFSDDDNCVGI